MNSGHFGMPGFSAANMTYEADIFWGGDESKLQVLRQGGTFSSAMVDAGNTPTSVIRKGLVLGLITATNKIVQWDATATDGSQNIAGVLGVELHMVDGLFTSVDRRSPLVIHAPLRAKSLLIKGAAFVGHADEYLARQQLAAYGCIFDDDPAGALAGMLKRIAIKATNYIVLASDNGTQFHAITADATFTLPAIKAGLSFEFLRASDHNLVVTSAEGDNVIVGNDLSADSITYSTAGNKIGARIKVDALYVNGTLKWLPTVQVAPFSTGTLLTQTLAT